MTKSLIFLFALIGSQAHAQSTYKTHCTIETETHGVKTKLFDQDVVLPQDDRILFKTATSVYFLDFSFWGGPTGKQRLPVMTLGIGTANGKSTVAFIKMNWNDIHDPLSPFLMTDFAEPNQTTNFYCIKK